MDGFGRRCRAGGVVVFGAGYGHGASKGQRDKRKQGYGPVVDGGGKTGSGPRGG